jgi:DNA topoisomerase-2
LIYFDKKKFSKYEDNPKKLIDILKLEKTISTNNMHLYNTNGVITKYGTANDILDAYYEYRLQFYDTRKENMIKILNQAWKILDNKCRFIRKVIKSQIKVFRQKIAFVREQLEEQGFDKFDLNKSGKESYDYLTSLPVYNFTEEKIIELKELRDLKKDELDELEETSIQELWYEDLDFVSQLNVEYNKTLEKERSQESSKTSDSKKKKRRGKR